MPLGFFALWALIGIFFAIDKGNSLHDYRSHLLRYVVFFFLLYNFFSSRKKLVVLSRIIMISTTAASIAGLWYFYIKLENTFATRFHSTFGEIHLNQTGILTVFATTLYLCHFRATHDLWRRLVIIVLVCPNVVATVLTQTRSAVLALFVTIFALFMDRKAVMAALVIALMAVVVVSPAGRRFSLDQINDDRLRQHLVSMEVIKDYPITGIGFGLKNYGDILDLKVYIERLPEQLQGKKYLAIPHSMLFNVAVRVGIVGLFFFLWVVFIVVKVCWASGLRGKDEFTESWGRCVLSAFLGFFVIGQFEPVFFHAGEVVLFTIFSMAAILWRLNNTYGKTRIEV